MYQPYNAPRRELIVLLSITALLLLIGTLFVYSASSVFALEKYGDAHFYFKRHALGVMLGIIAALCMQCIPLSLIKHLSFPSLIATFALTSMTLIPGLASCIHGSRRWLSLMGFVFQPSELLKVSLILYVSYYLTTNRHHLRAGISLRRYYIFIIIGAISALLLQQPDFGLAVTLCVTTGIMLFAANVLVRDLICCLIACIPTVYLLIASQPYRMKRILTFLDPWKDPQGAGFQIIQSLIAIGSGNIWGVGLGQSRQKFFYLPMQHTDFIFSIIAEETGFLGCMTLIMLYLVLLWCGIRIAHRLRDPFSQLFVFGTVTLMSLQALMNIGVATSLLPTKGIGLPLVSYGNTGLVCYLIMIGLIVQMVRQEQGVYQQQAVGLNMYRSV